MDRANFAEIVSYVRHNRTADVPFDMVISGHTPGLDRVADADTIGAYEAIGATWWIESNSPWDFGWNWQGPWPLDAMLRRMRQGPPRP